MHGCTLVYTTWWPVTSHLSSGQFLGPRLALESVAEAPAALVRLPLRFGGLCFTREWSSSIRGRGVWPLYRCASACVFGEVRLPGRVFMCGDAGESRDPGDFGYNAMGEESLRCPNNPPH